MCYKCIFKPLMAKAKSSKSKLCVPKQQVNLFDCKDIKSYEKCVSKIPQTGINEEISELN